MNKEEYFDNIKQYKLLAKHEVGQNVLIDYDVCQRIVEALDITENDNILEIGCGAGSLSYFLNESGAKCDLIDIDEALVTKVSNDFSSNKNVIVSQTNALKHDLSGYSKIIGNLPYYITSRLLEDSVCKTNSCQKAVFMIQKEVYSRLIAKPGTKEYSPLSIALNYRGVLKKEFIVPRTSFAPAPHIESLVFSITYKEDRSAQTAKELYDLTSKLFLFRRKTIYNNLNKMIKNGELASSLLEEAGIKENTRPEQITIDEYVTLLNVIKSRGL